MLPRRAPVARLPIAHPPMARTPIAGTHRPAAARAVARTTRCSRSPWRCSRSSTSTTSGSTPTRRWSAGRTARAPAQCCRRSPDTDLYAFDQACRVKAIELAARLGLDRRLSINFLPGAVYEPRACIQATLNAARRTGFRRDRLTFEILESESITNTAHLRNIIAEYRKQGFRIALDDFGTGHSGLLRLAELRPDVIKIDRALVMDCDRDGTRLAILAGLHRICAEIGIDIVGRRGRTGRRGARAAIDRRPLRPGVLLRTAETGGFGARRRNPLACGAADMAAADAVGREARRAAELGFRAPRGRAAARRPHRSWCPSRRW